MNYRAVASCLIALLASTCCFADGATTYLTWNGTGGSGGGGTSSPGNTVTQSPDINLVNGKYGKIALSMMTPSASTSNSPSTSGSAATPGLDYSFNWKTDQYWANQLGSFADDFTVALQGTGKYAFNTKTNVGALISTSVNAGIDLDRVITGKAPPDALTCDLRNRPNCADIIPNSGAWYGAFRFAPTASFETDQRFSDKQFLYGAMLAGQAYPADHGRLRDELVDVFDWPFKLTRLLTGHVDGSKYNPWLNDPGSWPVIKAEIQRVDPSADAQRKGVDPALNPYNRVHVGGSFESKVALIGTEDVRFLFNIDYWHELNASTAIAKAGLAAETYRSYAIQFQDHWTLSYTTGRVPLDYNDSKVWQIGYQVTMQ